LIQNFGVICLKRKWKIVSNIERMISEAVNGDENREHEPFRLPRLAILGAELRDDLIAMSSLPIGRPRRGKDEMD